MADGTQHTQFHSEQRCLRSEPSETAQIRSQLLQSLWDLQGSYSFQLLIVGCHSESINMFAQQLDVREADECFFH